MTVLLAGVLSILVFAAGCGGDDDDGSASAESSNGGSSIEVTTSSLNKDEFITKANKICDRGRAKAVSYAPAPGEQLSAAEQAAKAVEATVAPTLREVVADIEALGAPSGDEGQVEAYLIAMEEGIDDLEARQATLASLDAVEGSFRQSGDLAHSYGIGTCAFG